eukprot:4096094-Pyramimonas_sp.AAC.1
MTFKPPNSWQATCPRCDSGHYNYAQPSTRCRQTRQFKTPEQERSVELWLRHWMNSSWKYGSRKKHQAFKPNDKNTPSPEMIEHQKPVYPWLSGSECEDDGAEAETAEMIKTKVRAKRKYVYQDSGGRGEREEGGGGRRREEGGGT